MKIILSMVVALGLSLISAVGLAAEGTIKWFNPKTGYGFIDADTGPDTYVRPQDLKHKQRLRVGDKVRFERNDENKAINVHVIRR